MVRKIILVRHGSTHLNGDQSGKGDKIRGWIDAALDDRGIIEAHKVAKQLKQFPITFIASSDLQRATKTAAIIAKETGFPYPRATISPAFRPWHLGQFSGMESERVAPQIQKYAEYEPDTPVPDGESFHSFEHRFFTGFRMLLSHPGLCALVSHYRCHCLIEAWLAAGARPDGSIDHVNFCKKGEPPGHFKEFDIPVERLPQ